MESRTKRTHWDYPMAFKLAVVAQVENGELTYRQAQARYGIQGRLGRGSAAMAIDKTSTPLAPFAQSARASISDCLPMTDGYDCYQNALAERVNGVLKTEFLLHRSADLHQARHMIEESVRIYNHERPHLSLKIQMPDAVHRASLIG